MTKKLIGVLTVASAVVLAAGTLVASNMGFKLNYPLNAAGGGISATGTNVLGLPDNRQAGVTTALNLINDIGLANTASVSRFVEATDGFVAYTGRRGGGTDFPLIPGEGYLIKMNTTVNYIPSHY